MNSIIHLIVPVAGLVLMLHVTPSWAQPVCVAPGCNPTASDAAGNTAGGTNALLNVVSPAQYNTAFGYLTLLTDAAGNNNTAHGAYALNSNNGDGNTASGMSALLSNSTGNRNTATGLNALLANSSGHRNTANGALALSGNTAGIKNTALGYGALSGNTGSRNIAIGFKAGNLLASGNNNIYIGNPGAGSESLTMRLGNVQTTTFIAGVATASVSGAAVEIDTETGQLGILTSSARYKQDIAPMGTRSEGVLQLRPVTFAYRGDVKQSPHYGLIAEEVAAVYPELVSYSPSGEAQTVRYQELIPMLLNELQRQRQALHDQEQIVRHHQRELAGLRALVGRGAEAMPAATVAAGGTGSLPR